MKHSDQKLKQTRFSSQSIHTLHWQGSNIKTTNIFRLIELDRLTVNSREAERVEEEETKGADPDLVTRKPSETRGGVMEKLFKICGECGEEFCHGNCSKFDYEQHKEIQFTIL